MLSPTKNSKFPGLFKKVFYIQVLFKPAHAKQGNLLAVKDLLCCFQYTCPVMFVVFCHFAKCVLVHIRVKGEVSAVRLVLALQ